VVDVVGRVLLVALERDRAFHLDRLGPDRDVDTQLVQRGERLGVEPSDRLGLERHRAPLASLELDLQLVVAEVEGDLKRR
jgi:hypothetical protein